MITHYIGRPLIGLNFRQQRFEADFRHHLVRVREYSEAIALDNGEPVEHRQLDTRFGSVLRNYLQLIKQQKNLVGFTSFFGQAAVIFPFIVAAPRFFPIDDESLPGRTRERNALIVWGAATAILVAMVLDGAVVLAGNPAAEAAIVVAVVAGMAWQGREILHGASGWRAAAASGFTGESGEAEPDEPDDTTDAGDGIGPRRWLIAPTIDGLFLVDLDGEDKWFADAVDLPAELKARFEDFEDDVRAALVPHRSIAGLWMLPRATIADFERRATELATALEPHALAGEAMWWLPPADDVADEDLEPPPHPAL